MTTANLRLATHPAKAGAQPVRAANEGLGLHGVSLVYKTSRGPLTALENLSLQVRPAEFVAVLGPSGCGKSTLLKLASGLLPASGGTVALNGTAVDGPRHDVGIVFQQATLLPWKTVLDNVLVPIRARGLPVAHHRDKAMALLELVQLEKFASHYPSELSGGMQQRVAICRALVHDPDILLMDEPFAALDALTRRKMQDELLQLWDDTRFTVLFVTHSIQEAVRIGNRILLLSPHPGQVKAELNSDGTDPADGSGVRLSDRIHHMLFSEGAAAEEPAHV